MSMAGAPNAWCMGMLVTSACALAAGACTELLGYDALPEPTTSPVGGSGGGGTGGTGNATGGAGASTTSSTVGTGTLGCVAVGATPDFALCLENTDCGPNSWCDEPTGVCRPVCHDQSDCT